MLTRLLAGTQLLGLVAVWLAAFVPMALAALIAASISALSNGGRGRALRADRT
jgi:hypothetical protein